MDKRVCRKCRRNRKMTEDFDHGWCNSCVIDLKLSALRLEKAIKDAKIYMTLNSVPYEILDKALEGKDV